MFVYIIFKEGKTQSVNFHQTQCDFKKKIPIWFFMGLTKFLWRYKWTRTPETIWKKVGGIFPIKYQSLLCFTS